MARDTAPSISTAQLRSVVEFLGPEEMTPTARRILLSLCDQAEGVEDGT